MTPSTVEEDQQISKKFNLFTSRPTGFKCGWGSRTLNLIYSLPDVYSNTDRDYLTSITLPQGHEDDWLGTLGDLSSRVPLASRLTWVLDKYAHHGSRVALRIESFKDDEIIAVVERFERPAKFILCKHQHGPLCLRLSPPDNHSSYKYLLYVADKAPEVFNVGKYGAKPVLTGVDPHDYFHVHESFGEQMTEIKWPKAFVANNHGDTFQVHVLPPHHVVTRAIFDEHRYTQNTAAPTFRFYLLAMQLDHRRYGLIHCANRPRRILHVAGFVEEDQRSCSFKLLSISQNEELIEDIACVQGWLFALRYQTDPVQPHQLGCHSGAARLVCCRCLEDESGTYEWQEIEGLPTLYPTGRLMRSEFLGELNTLVIPTIRKHKLGWLGVNFGGWNGQGVPKVSTPGRFLDSVVDFFSYEDGDRECFKLTTARTNFTADVKFTHYLFDNEGMLRQLDRTVKWYPNAPSGYELGLEWSSVPGFCYRRVIRQTPRRPGRPRVALHLHGGPNGLVYRTYIPSKLLIADEMDFDLILNPNYLGSLGVSEAHCSALMGHVGTLDVSDCRKFLLDHLSLIYQGKFSSTQSDEEILVIVGKDQWPQIVCLGGSHGGFLGAHLMGQHPLLFAAAVLMNPVTDLVTAAGTTDIPDVINFECDGVTHMRTPPEEYMGAHAQIVRRDLLTKSSPLLWVADVNAPMAIFLGGSDLRVCPAQGREYYHALKAMGKIVELYWYPESNHAIAEPRNSEHFTTTTVQFLKRRVSIDEGFDATAFLSSLEVIAGQFPKKNDSKPSSVLYLVK